MPAPSTRQQPSGQHHCRFCNHKLRSAKQRCPACKRGQERAGEVIALLLMTIILGVVAYLLVSEDRPPPAEVYDHESIKLIPMADTRTASEAGNLEAFADHRREKDQLTTPRPILWNEPSQSSLRRPAPAQARPPKAAPLINYQGTGFRQTEEDFPYYVAEKKWNPTTKRYDFYRRGLQGAEVPMRGEARRYFISENQGDYPEPESGCGPTALLNLYIWYSKFGLLDESIRHANPQRYKELKFLQIDRKIQDIQKESRTQHGGTNTLASIVAMDELVQQYSRKPVRLHFEVKKPPLSQDDFTGLSRNYRAGILSVRPKDPASGSLLGNHAVLCIRGDRSGMITLANWGEFSHGRLVNRKDGQWFVPTDESQHELKINNLTVLIPFTPKDGL